MNGSSVTATISSLARYDTTLPMALLGIANQTVKPRKFLLFDDGHEKNLENHPVLRHIFAMFDRLGIEWEIILGQKKGQTANHQEALRICESEFIWRLDDDSVAEPDVLETLLRQMQDGVGAVGCLVLNPMKRRESPACESFNRIEDIYVVPNAQWCDIPLGLHCVDHLYSTFLFRKSAASHGYCKELSVVGHREETLFTYEMKRAGWQILLDSSVRIWDIQQPSGGTRLFDDREELFEHNERVFKQKLLEYGVVCR